MTAMGKHSVWRKLAKKYRRKCIRQKIARERDEKLEKEKKDKESSLEYLQWLKEQEQIEVFCRNEEERINEEENEKWLRRELIAQQQWRQLQDKIRKAKLEKAEQELRIRKEWEEEQKKIKDAEEKRRQIEIQQLEIHKELMNRIELFLSGNGELPSELLVGRETRPEKEICPFFSKTGACRFGDNCSRNHKYPGISKVLVANNFYANFGLEHFKQNEHGDDISLEFDDRETYRHFEDFFNDVLPEFQKLGRIVQFKVCLNYEKHLRGNTYIQYSTLPESLNAYRTFHGRWYGGRQISLHFCDIPSWKNAICGLFAHRKCPKGKSCNFLHVFRNPGNLFRELDDVQNNNRKHREHSKNRNREENWRWSESPSPERSTIEENSFENGRSDKTSRRDHSRTPRDRFGSHRSNRTERGYSKERSDRSHRSRSKNKSVRSHRSRSKDRSVRSHRSRSKDRSVRSHRSTSNDRSDRSRSKENRKSSRHKSKKQKSRSPDESSNKKKNHKDKISVKSSSFKSNSHNQLESEQGQ